MVSLPNSGDALKLVTTQAVSTDWYIGYTTQVDNRRNTSNRFSTAVNRVSTSGNITTGTTTTLLTVPDGLTAYVINTITVRNKHASSSQTVTLQKVPSGGTAASLTPDITLQAGESLVWEQANGLTVYDANGAIKTRTTLSYTSPQIMANPTFQTNDITSTLTIGPGWCVASYMGRAPRAADWVTVRARITTAVSVGAGEWCQVAIAKGDVVAGAAPTLTVVGFTSAEGTWNSTGLKSTVVSCGSGGGINAGDNLWIVAGASSGTGGINVKVRAGLADDLQGGAFALVSNEPSAIAGTATAFTLLGATVSAPWFELIV